jgi:hypothetical protein
MLAKNQMPTVSLVKGNCRLYLPQDVPPTYVGLFVPHDPLLTMFSPRVTYYSRPFYTTDFFLDS